MTRPANHLLVGLLTLLLVASAAATLPGLYLIGSDLQTSGEFLDGIGVLAGLAIIGVAALPAAASGMAIRAICRGNAARTWAVTAGALGTLTALACGFFYQPLLAVAVLPVILVMVALADTRVDA